MVAGERSTTTVPAQGLFLLNNVWVIGQSGITADRLLAGENSDAGASTRVICSSSAARRRIKNARPPRASS